MSIRQKMLIFIVAFIILPTLLMPLFTSNIYEGILRKKINNISRQNLTQVANQVETTLKNMSASLSILNNDQEMKNILSNNELMEDGLRLENFNKVERKLNSLKSTTLLFSYNANIIIIGANGNIYSTMNEPFIGKYNDIITQSWYGEVKDQAGWHQWFAPANKYFNFTTANKNTIAVTNAIFDNIKGFCGIAIIVLEVEDTNWLLFNGLADGEDTNTFLINQKGEIIYPDGKSLSIDFHRIEFMPVYADNHTESRTIEIGSERYILNDIGFRRNNWRIVQVIPYSYLNGEINKLGTYTVYMSVGLIAVLILVAILISYNISAPMHKLSLLMREVPKGNFKVRMKVNKVKSRSEIAMLSNSFNHMVAEMGYLVEKVNEEHRLREKARLEALQAQINPHFLFNTLNSIRWMATMNGAQNISNMISALADLLDATLYRKNEKVKLSEEIQCLENYVTLQKMRYGNRFILKYEIEEELMDFCVPLLILQPLVENSIIHAFKSKENIGEIKIIGFLKEEDVLIRVVDNGNGMSSEKALALLRGAEDQNGKFSRIGVKNVQDRIKLLYGQEYGLRIESEEGKGTIIELRLPAIQEGEQC